MNTKASQPVATPAHKTPITVRGAKVLIKGNGVTPEPADRLAVKAIVDAPKSNRAHNTPDRQALAMFIVAMFRLATGEWCAPKLEARRVYAGPSFIVDASTMVGARPGDDTWNDQSFVVSALKTGAGLADVSHLNIGMVRIDGHKFKVCPQYAKQ
jgi:hypothetical protein